MLISTASWMVAGNSTSGEIVVITTKAARTQKLAVRKAVLRMTRV